ncbi:hypothetical protein NQ315_016382, partial [Exocentrus adspersus]
DESLQVTAADGVVQGRTSRTFSGRPFWAYRGIPYARPPLGGFRFRAPKPVEPWRGVLDATREGAACVEIFLRSNGVFTSGQEDCLLVNVFTPQDPQAVYGLLPVMVWIYGGAFIEGNSSAVMWGPEFLLEEDVVVVTFNYRTGMMGNRRRPGFLSTEDSASPGNYGLKDQNLALKWVQKNIQSFGGNPKLVTVFGQSAGAASVLYHVASPKSKGLFHRAIASSGSSLSNFARKKGSRDTAFKVGTGLGIETKSSKELMSKLRKARLQDLNAVARTVTALGLVTLTQQGFPFGPVIEHRHKDAFISRSTYALLEKGDFNKVPIILGTTSGEAEFFKTFIKSIKPLTIIYDLSPGSFPNPAMNIDGFEKRREAGMEITRHYFKSNSVFDGSVEEIEFLLSDDQFLRPIRKTIQFMYKYVPVYFYVFSYLSDYGVSGFDDELKDGHRGVTHSEDLTYLWKGALRSFPENEKDKLMISKMVKLWTNFAKTGNPTPRPEELLENITWPPVKSPVDIKYLNIDSTLSISSNFREEYMQFWDYLYEKYGGKSYVTY